MLVVALVAAIHAGGHTNAATSPSSWDRRVAKYVRFVERHRSLEFDHPVPVKFLGDDAFLEAFRRDDPEITERDRVDAERSAGQLRALGLIEGPVDLIESQRDLDAADTVGFYDQERKALYVRGTDLTDVDVRITLVHELTHALQDQHFDLSKLDDEIETSGEDFALTALVEGDATSIEDDYLFSLPRAEQDAYFAEEPDARRRARRRRIVVVAGRARRLLERPVHLRVALRGVPPRGGGSRTASTRPSRRHRVRRRRSSIRWPRSAGGLRRGSRRRSSPAMSAVTAMPTTSVP